VTTEPNLEPDLPSAPDPALTTGELGAQAASKYLQSHPPAKLAEIPVFQQPSVLLVLAFLAGFFLGREVAEHLD